MTADVICFRPDADLKQLIMSECYKRGISVTEYMIQLVYGAFESKEALDKAKECLEGMRSHIINGEDPQELIEVVDALIEIID
jgi:hypothetical protein